MLFDFEICNTAVELCATLSRLFFVSEITRATSVRGQYSVEKMAIPSPAVAKLSVCRVPLFQQAPHRSDEGGRTHTAKRSDHYRSSVHRTIGQVTMYMDGE